MKSMLKFIRGWGFLLVLFAIAGTMLGLTLFEQSGFVGSAEAELSRATSFSIGEDTSNGNVTGATTGVDITTLKDKNVTPASINCFFAMAAPSGSAAIANSAVVNLETSADDTFYDVYQIVDVAASVVTGVYNVPATGSPMGEYWRINVTAIQNKLGDAYVTGKCFLE